MFIYSLYELCLLYRSDFTYNSIVQLYRDLILHLHCISAWYSAVGFEFAITVPSNTSGSYCFVEPAYLIHWIEKEFLKSSIKGCGLERLTEKETIFIVYFLETKTWIPVDNLFRVCSIPCEKPQMKCEKTWVSWSIWRWWWSGCC